MKILVYGAGVIGSYLAYELSKVGHDVFILARGKRYDTLKDEGLVINHYMQKKTTASNISVVKTFEKDDEYDVVFAVMQRTQINDVIPSLASNEKCKLYVLVGNNGDAEMTYTDFMNMSNTEKNVLFGFLGSGGRREEGRIISVHKNKTDFAIGDISKKTEYKENIRKIFDGTNIKPWYCDDIDSWLKYHLAIILPIAYAVHWAQGDMKKLSRSREILQLLIKGINEGISLLIHLNYAPEPKSITKMLKCPSWIWQVLLKTISATKAGKLAAGDHAMSAIEEMNLLSDEFSKLKTKINVKTTSLDKLEAYLIKK